MWVKIIYACKCRKLKKSYSKSYEKKKPLIGAKKYGDKNLNFEIGIFFQRS